MKRCLASLASRPSATPKDVVRDIDANPGIYVPSIANFHVRRSDSPGPAEIDSREAVNLGSGVCCLS